MKTDVVIIGGGIVGCAAAYYLARRGVHSIVVEKNAGVGLEASGCNGGGVRQHGRKAMLPLAMASVRMWANLEEELGSDLEYVRTGNINIAIDQAALDSMEEEAIWEQAHGLKDVRMLTARECHALVPGMVETIAGGKFCASDGVANPMLVSPAFARAGQNLGVQYRVNTRVTELLVQGTMVYGVQTESGEIRADAILNTAGPWAAQFGAQADCPMPIYPGRSQLLITERIPNNPVKMWVSVRGQGYMRPTASQNLVVGSGGARNDEYTRQIDYRSVAMQSERWSQLFPWIGNVSIIRICSGITEYTPDGCPYIGAVPGVSGLYVAAAFHGEGFCTGPAVGKVLADLVTGAGPQVSLEPFRPDRFAKAIKDGQTIPPVVYPLERMFLQPVIS